MTQDFTPKDIQKYYGQYGGMFVAQPMTVALEEVANAFRTHYHTQDFQQELAYHFETFAWRPTPITHLKNISDELWWAQIYLKREDLTTIGAHKINHAIVQAMLAQRMGKKFLIAETWAWMHGVSTATVAAKFGMTAKVFMWSVDVARQAMNVQKMELMGTDVISVQDGTKTLKDAVTAALKYRMNNLSDSYYLLWSALWPYPYPHIVRESQSVVGKECLQQFEQVAHKKNPDYIMACVWWWSNAIGIFAPYLDNHDVKLIGVEAAWISKDHKWKHAVRITWQWAHNGIYHGYKSIFLQDDSWNIAHTHSVSAWLDYPWIGPEHAFLADAWRVSYESATDEEVMDAFALTAHKEWILSALESAHALAHAYKVAPTFSKDTTILVNLSGRGDKDLHTVEEYMSSH